MENILINIDSRFRDSKKYKNAGNFTYNLSEPLKNITYIRLSSIELPNLFYNFNSMYLNTSFKIILNNIEHDVTIDDGNYSAEFMINKIQSILDVINITYSTNFTISWNNINYKVTILNSTPFGLIFHVGNDTDEIKMQPLGYYLGFRFNDSEYLAENQPNKTENNQLSYYWTGNTFLDVTKDEYLFLKINDYGTIYNDIRSKGLFAKIILFDNQFIIDNGSNFLTKKFRFKQPINISKLNIELISPQGYIIDMNDIDFSFTLELGQIYDSNLITVLNENESLLLNTTTPEEKKDFIKNYQLLNLFNHFSNY